MRAAEVVIAGVLLAVLALGVALLPLLTPAFTATLSARHSDFGADAALLAEASRSLVVSDDADARAIVAAAMEPDAVIHLDDVGNVIAGAKTATLVLAMVCGAWVAWCLRVGRMRPLAFGLRAGGGIVLGGLVLAALAGTTDFDALFARFHQLFFAEGTWTFPSDSVLIRVFPESFWVSAGVAWAVVCAVIASVYLLAGWALLRPRKA